MAPQLAVIPGCLMIVQLGAGVTCGAKVCVRTSELRHSVGAGNRFRHLSFETLARLEKAGVPVWMETGSGCGQAAPPLAAQPVEVA